MITNAKVVIKADSRSLYSNKRCTTFLLENFPYRLIQEPSTHRLISFGSDYIPTMGNTNPFTEYVSRNSASTRAIPVSKIIENIIKDPYIPTFTRNKPGMQGVDDLSEAEVDEITSAYMESMHSQLSYAQWLSVKGAHKQEVNGIISPYMRIPVLCTATEWRNFFSLRNHKDVHPDLQLFASEMEELYKNNIPNWLGENEWHLPFYTKDLGSYTRDDVLKICTARNARLSYNRFDGNTDPQKDLELYNQLLSEPLHGSPFEHNLTVRDTVQSHANFTGGFISMRKLIELGEKF